MYSLGHDDLDKQLGLKDDKAPSVRLPPENVRQAIVLNLLNDAMEDHGKGRRDPAFASADGGLGRIVGFVGEVVIVVNHVVTLVLIDGLARFKVTGGSLLQRRHGGEMYGEVCYGMVR